VTRSTSRSTLSSARLLSRASRARVLGRRAASYALRPLARGHVDHHHRDRPLVAVGAAHFVEKAPLEVAPLVHARRVVHAGEPLPGGHALPLERLQRHLQEIVDGALQAGLPCLRPGLVGGEVGRQRACQALAQAQVRLDEAARRVTAAGVGLADGDGLAESGGDGGGVTGRVRLQAREHADHDGFQRGA
jgi:hypothetical protein